MSSLATPRRTKVWTDEALQALPKERGKHELIDGRLTRMPPAKPNHGLIGSLISAALWNHVLPRKLGVVFDASAGFRLDADNVLSPDVSFHSTERLQREPPDLERFILGAPDLAVEVISPSERRAKIILKREKYFASGTHLVWLVYPRRKAVEVFTASDVMTLKRTQAGDELDGGDVLPGFRLPLQLIFAQFGGFTGGEPR